MSGEGTVTITPASALVLRTLCYFGLYWVFVLIVIGNDDFASIIGVKSKMLKELKMIAILRANEFNCKVRGS
jgi:hypothetical protein